MKGHKPHSLEIFPIVVDDSIIHYTCNAPPQTILDKYKIESLGEKFHCADSREVLRVPFQLYLKAGFSLNHNKYVLKLNLEKLMRELV